MRREVSKSIIHHLFALHNIRPNISNQIELFWGTKAGHDYFKKILVKDRKIRLGLDAASYLLVMHLYLVHVVEYRDFDSPIVIGTNPNIESV